MTQFTAYLAMSLDGYIAERDGGVDFLKDYDPNDFGYQEFFAGVDRLVMGRASFDQALGFGEWQYGSKPAYVVTSRPLPEQVPPAVRRWDGTIPELAEELQRGGAGKVWLFGGRQLLSGFLDGGLVDELDLFVIPVLLGQGIPFFSPWGNRRHLELLEATAFPRGVVRLRYSVAKAQA